jgi:hypothetical protein
MEDENEICSNKECNCRNVEPIFRAWYHKNEKIEEKNTQSFINTMFRELAILIAKTPGEGRCKALAQTKLQESLMWFKEGITKETE